jgi:ribonuclease Y
MEPILINAAVTFTIAAAVFAWYLVTRRRIAADTIERARSEADRLLRDAVREAEALKKEALLEAKEKAHDFRLDAEKQIRERREELATLEQSIARRDAITTEQRAQLEEQMRALRTREQVINERERATQATAARFEQLVAERQRELERVAGLTAEEAPRGARPLSS